MSDRLKISLKYNGPLVDEGEMDVQSVIEALQGFSGAYSRVHRLKSFTDKHVLNIKSIENNCFEVILNSVKEYGNQYVLGSISDIVTIVSSVATYIHCRKKSKGEKIIEKNNNIIDGDNNVIINLNADNKHMLSLMENSQFAKNIGKLVKPLREGKIEQMTFSYYEEHTKKVHEESVSWEERHYFDTAEEVETIIHKSIELNGFIRALDKKTNKGKFIDGDGKVYKFTLIMDNPRPYYIFFSNQEIKINGIATFDKEIKEILKIEIEEISKVSEN